MASSLRSNLSIFNLPYSSSPTKPQTIINLPIQCGPRDNRSPLQKGRILSSEAMQAIQALKRSKSDETKLNLLLSKTLTRLVKSDLIASLQELLRQNHLDLALKVFSTVRSEFWYKTDCSLYADMVCALAKNGMMEEIDRLVLEFEGERLGKDEFKRISRLIRALTAAKRNESVIRVFGVMKNGGWECKTEDDEYVVKILSRGLRRLGEGKVADEVELEYGVFSEGKLVK